MVRGDKEGSFSRYRSEPLGLACSKTTSKRSHSKHALFLMRVGRPIECHCLDDGALIVDDHPPLRDGERELHDFRALIGRLLMRVHERRRHQRHVFTWQIEFVGNGSCTKAKRFKRSGD